MKRMSVAILLCTLNGGRFLSDQLDSIEGQTFSNWIVHLSDDGSKDETLEIVDRYTKRWGAHKLVLHSGPKTNSAANFLSLVRDKRISADFYAYCDQDDIWEADKLDRSQVKLSEFDVDLCLLYCSRTTIMNQDGVEVGSSPLFSKKPCFRNALVQNVAGGNTMVFNNTTRNLLVKLSAPLGIVGHDWLTYLMVSGSGGLVYYDAHPTVRYRKHGGNLMGPNRGLRALLSRFFMILRGRYRGWVDLNVRVLKDNVNHLNEKSRLVLIDFLVLRSSSALLRPYYFLRSGIFRQSLWGTIALAVASFFGMV